MTGQRGGVVGGHARVPAGRHTPSPTGAGGRPRPAPVRPGCPGVLESVGDCLSRPCGDHADAPRRPRGDDGAAGGRGQRLVPAPHGSRRAPGRRGVAREDRPLPRGATLRDRLHLGRHGVGQPRRQGHLLGSPRPRPCSRASPRRRDRAPRRARLRRLPRRARGRQGHLARVHRARGSSSLRPCAPPSSPTRTRSPSSRSCGPTTRSGPSRTSAPSPTSPTSSGCPSTPTPCRQPGTWRSTSRRAAPTSCR